MNSMVPFGKRVQLSTFNGSSFGQGSALKRGWDWLCNAHLNVKFLPRINAEPGFVSAANLSNHVNLSNLSECAKIGQLRDAPVPAMEGQFYGGYNVVGTSMDYNSTHMNFDVCPLIIGRHPPLVLLVLLVLRSCLHSFLGIYHQSFNFSSIHRVGIW